MDLQEENYERDSREKHEDQDDLARRQPELSFSIPSHGKHIDGSIQHYARNHNGCSRYVVGPISQDYIKRRNLKGNEDSFVEKKVPADGETKSLEQVSHTKSFD